MTKQNMIKYISSFQTHGDGYRHHYAINVRLRNLPLTSTERDNLYTIIGDESLSQDFYGSLNSEIDIWKAENKALFGTYNIKEELRVNICGLSEKELKARIQAYKNPESIWKYDRHGSEIMTCWRMTDKTYFDAGFGGRSGGWLELYRWNGHNYGQSWRHSKEELEEMSKEEVREIYKILQAFEKLSEYLTQVARGYAQEEVTEEEYTITKTRKVFKSNLD